MSVKKRKSISTILKKQLQEEKEKACNCLVCNREDVNNFLLLLMKRIQEQISLGVSSQRWWTLKKLREIINSEFGLGLNKAVFNRHVKNCLAWVGWVVE